jgi:hypothetical protein
MSYLRVEGVDNTNVDNADALKYKRTIVGCYMSRQMKSTEKMM